MQTETDIKTNYICKSVRMEKLVERYTNLQTALESVQAAGKFNLSEAGGLCMRLGQLKAAIEEINTLPAQPAISTPQNNQNSQEIEDIKVKLVSKNIALDTAQRKLKIANEKLAKLEAAESVKANGQPAPNAEAT